MKFIKTFKGYEDKTALLDAETNQWIATNAVEVVSVQTVLAHEENNRAKSGDLIYTIVYEAESPIA